MDKSQEFLLIVQTGLIIQYSGMVDDEHRGMRGTAMARAIWSSKRLPSEISAEDAATAFLELFTGVRKIKDRHEEYRLPVWLRGYVYPEHYDPDFPGLSPKAD